MTGADKYGNMQSRCLVFLFICLSFFSCAESEPFPEYMTGRWFTDQMLYDNRYIEISEDQIVFGTGQVEPSMFFINKYQSKKQGKTVEWRFDCELGSGDVYTLFMIYHPDEESGWIQLKNTPRIHWYRYEDS